MRLSDLLSGLPIEELLVPDETGVLVASHTPPVLDILDISDDSRRITPNSLFVALPGQTHDGHQFAADVVKRGAVALLVQRPCPVPVPQIRVQHTPRVLSLLAANFYRRPAESLSLLAVTGTNGKTTTTHLVQGLLEHAEVPTGLIGTNGYRFHNHTWPAPFTTPTSLLLQKTLAEMHAQGAKAVVMEASSHALALSRLVGVRFRVAAFANLTQDHLDFHRDMEDYFAAKSLLFTQHLLPAEHGGRAVLFVDDPYGRRLASSLPAGLVLTVSLTSQADVRLLQSEMTFDGLTATFGTPLGELRVTSALTGRFNLANLAVALGMGIALGLPPAVLVAGLSQVSGVPGRLERIAGPPGSPSVFVDYAHTPDALGRVLATLRELRSPSQRTARRLVVFGCGGNRDASKRPVMGRTAAQEADLVVVTSDNPRNEDPQRILDAIVPGILSTEPPPVRVAPTADLQTELSTHGRVFCVEPDRRRAIRCAIAAAHPGDLVLIAGKGHEDYQLIGDNRTHFDDREEARLALSLASAQATSQRSWPSDPGIGLPLSRVLSATQGQLTRGHAHLFSSVTIDSRAVLPGALFVAIAGQRVDGHSFCAQAIAAGAQGVLVQRGVRMHLPASAQAAVIEVPDTTVALGLLARAHRMSDEIACHLRVLAITGSSGKTSTKELLAAICAAACESPQQVLKTEGNLNNHLGVPLTLLRLRPGHRFAVIELGMSALGEIAYLTSLCRPDVGLITNVGTAHLATLGSVENIARAKGEIFSGLDDKGLAVFHAGHALVLAQAKAAGIPASRLRPVFFTAADAPLPGAPEPNVLICQLLAASPRGSDLRLIDPAQPDAAAHPVEAHVPLVGTHQAENAALAAAAAYAVGIPLPQIARGLSLVTQAKHRGQTMTLAGRHVLDDCYNANPSSVLAALSTLEILRGAGRAIAVLGDMLELGPTEAALHEQVGEAAAQSGISLLITVGERAQHIAHAASLRGIPTHPCKDAAHATQLLVEKSQPGDWILIKGSRGMALENVLAAFAEALSTPLPLAH